MNPLVLDTGVLVSGIYWRHEPHSCLRAWELAAYQLVITAEIFDEYQDVVWRVKAKEKLAGDPTAWLELVHNRATWVDPAALERGVCRDPKDDKFIAAALGGGANMVIARDPDLTALEKPFGIQILTPRAFMASLPRNVRRQIAAMAMGKPNRQSGNFPKAERGK